MHFTWEKELENITEITSEVWNRCADFTTCYLEDSQVSLESVKSTLLNTLSPQS